jgi:hypothetical protein
MEPEIIELSLTDFLDNKLSKTEFSREQVENLARMALDKQFPFEYTIRNMIYRVPAYQIAIYFGLASPFPRAEKEEPDEVHVSRDPIGMDEAPPETEAKPESRRKPGRPRKA